jgi:CRP-like cAMP-binding protein
VITHVTDTRNEILRRLEPDDYDRLSPSLEPVELAFKQVLYEQDAAIDYVYFLERGIVSLVTVFDDGGIVETGTVGNEGVVGLPAMLGTGRSPDRTLCQIVGGGKRMRAHIFRDELHRGISSSLVRLTLRYADGVLKNLAQTAACNRMHPVEERLSRWLLTTLDRVGEANFALTQEFMAQMLGVRRPAVNIAGAALQRAGLIRYTRGKIEVVDRRGLEQTACECYAKIKNEFKRVFEDFDD